jgi:hypothetical protein
MKNRINAITEFYKGRSLPKSAIIDGWTVKDVQKFVSSHLRYINNNKPKFVKPYLERLEKLKNIIEQKP